MVSLWWSQSALDDQIDKATSELLPTNQEDIALHFTISDHIRSKRVNSKEAMRSLKRRLQHKNPNVQLAALSLTDTCVKNAGDAFVREIASREFMETLTMILHSPDCNLDVKNKILAVIQTWAIAAKNNPSLNYLTDTYHLLQHERFQFPPLNEHVNALLLETAAPPEWTDSDVCERCRTPFTFTNRKHHCRNCGGTFCQECSSKNLPLPHLAIDDHVRVCYGCYIKLKLSRVAKKDPVIPPPQLVPTPKNTTRHEETTTSAPVVNGSEDKQFEEDLKRAIELSKAEAEQHHYAPSAAAVAKDTDLRSTTQYGLNGVKEEEAEEEDPELAAAIAASLRDMEDAQKTELEYYNQQSSSRRTNTEELSNTEMDNIELFATLMERMSATAVNNIGTDEQINQLYTQIATLQPKLVKNLDDAIQRHNRYSMLHEKLNNAVRTYDRLLEQKVASSYQRVSNASIQQQPYGVPQSAHNAAAPQQYPVYPQTSSQSLYPSMQPSNGQRSYPGQPSPYQPPFATSPRPTTLSPTAPSHGNPLSGIQAPTSMTIPTQDPTPSADQPEQRHFLQTVSAVGDNHHVSYNYDNNLGRWVTTNVSQIQQQMPPPPAPQQVMNLPPAPTHTPQQQQQQATRPQVEEPSLIEL
ncbi:vacuolar protein sorting-associated protein 27 [Lichtheimia corymbifera JMRC:FSU:9682]|uniref:Vacuolar protein sorting-associated protein 27 n=1 Tax=Lichtheimia corymbifera JMRC:FSU:9682 TaxID=1263082 RepID=A0A068RQQ4_9FUNG|nr:vacuolar protein sorting-associated protein 27 [Lichtheimia corymbifera JMRC:FSU:9682]